MKKRIFCMLILALILISLFAIGASADYDGPISVIYTEPTVGMSLEEFRSGFAIIEPLSGVSINQVLVVNIPTGDVVNSLEGGKEFKCYLSFHTTSGGFSPLNVNGKICSMSEVCLNQERHCFGNLLFDPIEVTENGWLSFNDASDIAPYIYVSFPVSVEVPGETTGDPGEQEDPESPAIPENDRFKEVNISIAENLAMTFYYTPEENEPYTDYRTQATLHLAGGGEVSAELSPRDKGEKKAFTFTGIAPQCMCDELTQILQGKKEDGTWEDIAQMSCSVRDYCIRLLEGNKSNEPLRKLIYDLLAYGSAAQSYRNYNTGNLADAGYSQEGLRTVFSADEVKNIVAGQTNYGNGQSGKCFHGAVLLLNNVNYICFNLEISNPENAKDLWVSLDYGGEYNLDTVFFSQMEMGEDGVYHCYSRPLSLCSSGNPVDATLYDGKTELQRVTYSVNHYIARKYDSTDSNLKHLLQRLYCLGKSAKAYGSSN